MTGLATRALPPLSLHAVQFGSEGAFLRQDVVPTSSWDDNSILFTARGDLRVRSGEKLRLFSAMHLSEILPGGVLLLEQLPLSMPTASRVEGLD